METHPLASEELPICLTWAHDQIHGEAPAEEYIAGTWKRDGEDILLRIRFYDRRRKREHISIYEVRGDRGWGEEFLIFEKPAAFSYPPSATEILRHLEGIIGFPATLRLQWAARGGLVVVAAAALAEGANPNEMDGKGKLPLDALTTAAGKAAADLLESHRRLASRGGGDEKELIRTLAELSDLYEIRSLLLAAGAKDHGAFRKMVRDANFEGAQAEFDKGIQIDAVSPNGTTLLIERILHRDKPAVAWLLEHGANPDWNSHGKLPHSFRHACPYLRVEDSPLLALTPFSASCMAGFPEALDLLVGAGSSLGSPEVLSLYKIFADAAWPEWVLERIEAIQARRTS